MAPYQEGHTTMKLSASISTLALVASIGSAFGADLATKKAPPIVEPLPIWNGFYVGLNAGGTWASNNVATSTYGLGSGVAPYANNAPAVAAATANPYSTSNNFTGFIGGGQVGYNWQFRDKFILGGEADIQGVASNSGSVKIYGTGTDSTGTQYSTFGNRQANLSYLGTVRGRVGYLFTPSLLVYGTGGVAYGNASTSTSYATSDTRGGVGYGTSNTSNTQVGWTAGGGVEWMFMQNWSAKAEYLYYNLGSANSSATVTSANNAWAYNVQNSTQFNGNLVRAGVSYHFNLGAAPVVAKY